MKTIAALVALSLISGSVLASNYAGFDYSDKQKVGVPEHHDVYGFTVGTNLTSKFSIEGRMEDEIVHEPSKHEGLFQVRTAYNLFSVDGFTPYLAGAVGYKSKATINFDYYVVEGGLKYDVLSRLQLKAVSRLRTPFNESNVGTGNKYRTVENSITAAFKITQKNTVSIKGAWEHGDSNYHTWGVGYSHTF